MKFTFNLSYIILALFLFNGCGGYSEPQAGVSSGWLHISEVDNKEPQIVFSVKLDGSLLMYSSKKNTFRVAQGKHILAVKTIAFYGNRAKENTHINIPIEIKTNHRYRIVFAPSARKLSNLKQPVDGTVIIYDGSRIVAKRKTTLQDAPGRVKVEQAQQDLVNDAIISSVVL